MPENFDIITDMFTDAFVTYAVECFAQYAQLSQNVYQYRYVHQGEFGLNPDAGIDKLGKVSKVWHSVLRGFLIKVQWLSMQSS